MRNPSFKLSLLAFGLAAAFSASAQVGDAVLKARIDSLEKSVADLSNSVAKVNTDTGLPLHGFIDVTYASTGGKPPSYEKSGFHMGVLDLYLTPRFSDRVKGLVEIAYEYGRDGSMGVDVERMQLGYEFGESSTLWFGRFHTPFGYWNNAFHHGAQIQTSIQRPRFIGFEDQGGILPAHSVGGWVHNKTDVGFGKLTLDGFVANSGSMRDGTLDFNAVGHDAGSPRVGFNIGISPSAVPGLTVGVHALQERMTTFDGASPTPLKTGEVTVQMTGGYMFFESDRWEVIGEYYAFNNTDLMGTAGSNKSTAWFLQTGYQLVDRLTAFVRYEKADLSTVDPYFTNMNSAAGGGPAGNTGDTNFGSSYKQSTVGLRYDLDPRSAIKLQFEQIVDDGNAGQTVNWVRTQFAARF